MAADYGSAYSGYEAGGGILVSGVIIIIYIAIIAVFIAAAWKIYAKAGKPGWASLVPFYNNYVLFDIAMGNGWLFLLLLVPVVNVVMSYYIIYRLAKAFDKGIGYTLGLIFLAPIFICMLAFGDAEYVGPNNN